MKVDGRADEARAGVRAGTVPRMLLRRKFVAWASDRPPPDKACHYAHSPRRASARSGAASLARCVAAIFEAISFGYFSYKIAATCRRASRAPTESSSFTVPTETSR